MYCIWFKMMIFWKRETFTLAIYTINAIHCNARSLKQDIVNEETVPLIKKQNKCNISFILPWFFSSDLDVKFAFCCHSLSLYFYALSVYSFNMQSKQKTFYLVFQLCTRLPNIIILKISPCVIKQKVFLCPT